jgi:hypothetical protein
VDLGGAIAESGRVFAGVKERTRSSAEGRFGRKQASATNTQQGLQKSQLLDLSLL